MKKLLLLYKALQELDSQDYTITWGNGDTINVIACLKRKIRENLNFTGEPKIIDNYIVMYDRSTDDLKFYPKEEIT